MIFQHKKVFDIIGNRILERWKQIEAISKSF